jgi:oligosaccharyltransferase complex subunit beta
MSLWLNALIYIASIYVLVAGCVGKDVLVLLADPSLKSSHSTFLADLRDAGLQLDVKQISDQKLRLQRWGRWLYDGVLVLAGKSGNLGGALDSAYLVELVDSGRSLFIATDENASSYVREAAAELGTDLLAPGSQVMDHIAHSSDLGASAILSDACHIPAIVGSPEGSILYRGGAMTISSVSTLSAAALTPKATAMAKSEGAPLLLGPALTLASAMQTRKSARFFIVASMDALSDAFFTAKVHGNADATGAATSAATGNRVFAHEVAMWTFHEKSMLRISNFKHTKQGHLQPPPLNTYTVNDTIHVELDLMENRGQEWRPHVTDKLQAQFVMLDPHVRQPMKHTGGGHYELTIRAPDVYGAFKWVIDYKTPGFSPVSLSEVTPLRPLRHNEYPRFILQAYPYYAALISVSVGFFVMITLVMYL